MGCCTWQETREWTADWYHRSAYAAADTTDPTGPRTGRWKSIRGGSFMNLPSSCTCTHREPAPPEQARLTLDSDALTPWTDRAGMLPIPHRSRRWLRLQWRSSRTSLSRPRASRRSAWFGSAEGWSSWAPRHGHSMPPKPGPGPLPKYVSTPPREQPASAWYSRAGMGLPKRRARVAPFLMDQTEVTQAAYAGFVEEAGYRPPHVSESWADAAGTGRMPADPRARRVIRHADQLLRRAGVLRLAREAPPTEAEWQIAALGPADARPFPWGARYRAERLNHGQLDAPHTDDSDGHAWTAPVGQYRKAAVPPAWTTCSGTPGSTHPTFASTTGVRRGTTALRRAVR